VIVRNRSWPAVSQICSFTHLLSSSTFLILKSMPMVVMKLEVNESSAKRRSRQLFPTPARHGDRGRISSARTDRSIAKRAPARRGGHAVQALRRPARRRDTQVWTKTHTPQPHRYRL
jgi:hypothetical protein